MLSVFCRQHIGRRVWLPWLRLITGGDLIQCAIKHRKCDYIPLMMVILFCGDNICFVALFINKCSLSVFGLCNTRWNNTVIIQMAASILLLYTTSSAGKVGHNRSRSQPPPTAGVAQQKHIISEQNHIISVPFSSLPLPKCFVAACVFVASWPQVFSLVP